ncbi:MAG: Gfo/Idh/MocA family protein [Lysobacterales bacterium]
MNKRLRVAVVGCGQIADGHVEEIGKIEQAELVAVCDLEPILAEQLARRYQVNAWYDDFARLLTEQSPDVVHICTPPASHKSILEQAVAAGAHVYVEKPFAIHYDDAKAMIDCAESAGKLVTIGHNSHLDPAAVRMRKIISSGSIGEVVHVESWFGYNLSGSFGKLIYSTPDHWVHQLPGGLLQNNINHLMHKLTEFVLDDSPTVDALAWRSDVSRHYGDRRDNMADELRLNIRGEKVTGSGVFTTRAGPVGHFQHIYGTQGQIRVDYNTRAVVLDRGVVLPSAIGRLLAGVSTAASQTGSAIRNLWHFTTNRYHYFAGMQALIRQFYQAIAEGREPPISHQEILRITRLLDEVFEQASGGSSR